MRPVLIIDIRSVGLQRGFGAPDTCGLTAVAGFRAGSVLVAGGFVPCDRFDARHPRAILAHSRPHAEPRQDPAVEGDPDDEKSDEQPKLFHRDPFLLSALRASPKHKPRGALAAPRGFRNP